MSVKVWRNRHRWGPVEDLHMTCLDCGKQLLVVHAIVASVDGRPGTTGVWECHFTRGEPDVEPVDIEDRR